MNKGRAPLSRLMVFFLTTLFTAISYAGSAGVKNGFVEGMVRAVGGNPLPGVNVVLVRENSTPLIRNTLSGENGMFQFPQVPVGLYTLGFAKFGFEPITTEAGDPESQSAIGSQFRVYVESGAHVRATPVTLKELSSHGRAVVSFKLVDQVTGDPVPSALVTLGNAVGVPAGAAGEYQVEIYVPPTNQGIPEQKLTVHAPGFESLSESIRPIPNEPNNLSVEVTPLLGIIQGQLDFSGFTGVDLSKRTRITVSTVPSHISNARIDPSGHFELSVPVSTPERPRFFNLHFHIQGFISQVISNIHAPLAGATTLTHPIRLQVKTTRLQGRTLTSLGDSGVPSGLNQAFVAELGISTPIHGGNYLFEAVPTGIELSVQVFLKNREGVTERGEILFTATINGQAAFQLPTILTKPK